MGKKVDFKQKHVIKRLDNDWNTFVYNTLLTLNESKRIKVFLKLNKRPIKTINLIKTNLE